MLGRQKILHITIENRKATPLADVQVGDTRVKPSSSACNLGDNLCMTQHVNNICRNATHRIRCIGRIRHYLDQATTEKLVHTYVSSRLVQCNSLLYGLPDEQINKLQRVQNAVSTIGHTFKETR